MLTVRRSHAAFGRGTLRFLYPKNRKVLAYLREYQDETILCVANVSRTPQAVELDLSEFAGRVPVELNGGSLFPPIGQLTYLLTLPPYGFYWFILAKESEAPSWHTPAPEPMPDFVTLVLRDALGRRLERQRASSLLEREALPAYLAKRRWFSAKDQTIEVGAHRLYGAAAGRRPRAAAGRDRDPDRRRDAALADAAVDRLGRRASGTAARPARPVARASRPPGRPADRRLRRCRPSRCRCCRRWPSGTQIETDEGQIVFEPMPGAEQVLRPKPDADGQLAVGRAVQQLADRRRRRRCSRSSAGHARRASRSRDGPLSDRARLRQLAHPARRGDAHRQAGRAPFARRRAGLHPQPGRRLDLDAEPVQARGRRSRHPRGRARRAPTRSRTTRPSPPPSAASSPRCTRCWRATPTTRPSRRRTANAEDVSRWIDRALRPARTGRSTSWARSRPARTKTDDKAIAALTLNKDALMRRAGAAGASRASAD